MSVIKFRSASDFARRAPIIFRKDVEALADELSTRSAKAAAGFAVSLTPLGPERLPHQKRKGAPYSEHMRDLWFFHVGKGADRPISAIGSLRNVKLGDIRIFNTAPHGKIIDKGRFKSQAENSKKSRDYGSSRAPRGISRPADEKFGAAMDAIARTAVAAVERRPSSG